MAEQNFNVVDFDELTEANDGKTVLYADGQVCKSENTIGELVDSKIDGKGYATESFVTGKIDGLSGTVSTEYATKEELRKVGNFIVTEGDDEGPTLEPSEAETKNIYLVKDAGITGTDQYREWIVAVNEQEEKIWTCIGDTSFEFNLFAGTDLKYENEVMSVNTDGSALGTYAFVEGKNTQANGYASHAEGGYALAAGNYSHAGGFHTTAGEPYMTVIGKYNNRQGGAAFVVGNGTDTANSDAFIVDWNGNTTAAGTLTISGVSDVGAALANIDQLTAKVQELETLLNTYSGLWVLTNQPSNNG